MVSGIDSPVDCGKFVKEIKNANASFVGRYYRSSASIWPKLTLSEAKILSAAGLQIVALWESASDHASYFSFAHGVRDASAAYVEASQVGQPMDTPIYFAVDFDASKSEIKNQIADYFRGVAAGFKAAGQGGPCFETGVYGSGATCSWLLENHLATKSWLAVSSGWSGYDFKDWNIKQGKSLKLGFNNDSDQAKPGFGAFKI